MLTKVLTDKPSLVGVLSFDRIELMTLETFKKKAHELPDAPGVYFFLDAKKKILYIGKATSLRSRVRSYFTKDLLNTRGPLLVDMVGKATMIDWRQTDSVLEALILEANLVRTHKPKHNTDLKDDKSFNYVVVTKEDFPKILLVRGKELLYRHATTPTEAAFSTRTVRSATKDAGVYTHIFGPFPHGSQLKEALRIVRKIFPYRDEKCTACADKQHTGTAKCKPCFNRHIGLCPGVCTGEIRKVEYRKIVRRITLFFQGKKTELLTSLERDMKAAAKREHFEEAATLRTQVFALHHIQDVSLIKDEYRSPSQQLGGSSNTRIEAYDAAHLGGSAAVGVMVVVEAGEVVKSEYRKFILKSTKPGDDPGALREILSRRLGHNEWRLPRLMVIDGSTAQLNAASTVLAELGLQIPLVGVVKDERHRPRGLAGDPTLTKNFEKDILLANSEAHRYAISFHRKRLRERL